MAQVFLPLPLESNLACISSNPSHRHGKGNEGNEGHEEDGSHEGNEGDEEEGGHEGNEGDEEEGGHEGHEGDEEEGGHEGNEGDDEEGGHEGHEGNEEEVCEQDREGPACKSHGSSWEQGEDRWGHDSQGSLEEQVWRGCEQEEVCLCQEVPMDSGRDEGTQGSEDHWLRCHQEGHTSVCKGKGVLQPVSAALSHVRIGTSSRCGDFHSCGAPHP